MRRTIKIFKFLLVGVILTFTTSCEQYKHLISNKGKKTISKKEKKHSSNTGNDIKENIKDYEIHIIKPKETIYGLTRKYNISKKELIKLNPNLIGLKYNKLNIGDTLRIKEIQKETSINLDDNFEDYITHKVAPKETIYSLTRHYNISKEDLIKLNQHLPELKNNKLNINDILKIRLKNKKTDSNESNLIYPDIIETNKTIKLALMLPFKANEYDTIKSVDIFKGKKGILANMVTDFYLGAEIAIDSLSKQGIKIKTKVFDTGNRDKNIPKIIKNNDLNNKDVIIGSFYSEQVEKLANKVTIPVIFPHFSSNQSEFTSSKLVKTVPDTETYIDELIDYLKNNYNGETIFVVGDRTLNSNLKISKIVSSLKEDKLVKNITILKSEKGYIQKEKFTNKMKPENHYWVIMASDDNVTIADTVNTMIALPENVTSQVFAIYKSKAYDRINNNKLGNIQFTFVSNTFVDNSDEATNIFNNKYEKKNHSLPSEYAIKGFDITYDILMRLASGDDLYSTFKQGTSIRIANKFNYNKKTFGSTNNKGLFIVKYNKDLSLTRLK